MKIRITAFMLVVAMLFVLCACGSSDKKKENKKETEKTEYSSADAAISTANTTFTRAEVAYAFYESYNDFKNNNAESVDMYNIDTEASLKEQEYHDGITWFDYFVDSTSEYLKELAVYCEAAKAEGYELDDEDRKKIDETVKTWEDYAENYYYPIDKLLADSFCADVTVDVMRSFMEKETLAQKYYTDLANSFEITDGEIEKFVEDNENEFYYVDYMKYTLDEDDTPNVKAECEKIAAAKSEEEFVSAVKKYMTDILKTEEDKQDTSTLYTKFAKKSEGSEVSEWAFGGAKAGETYVRSDELDGRFTVYYLLSEPSLEETPAKNIRFFTESITKHKSFKETENTVNDMLKKWATEDGTEEGFAAIVPEDSKQENSGVIENVMKSDTTLPEGMSEWLFSDERKPGDTAAFKGGDSYYVGVLYTGDGEAAWKIAAKSEAVTAKIKENYSKLLEKYPATVYEGVIDSIDA